jgi:hypothetical protein
MPPCLNGCSRDAQASCEGRVSGDVIDVETHGSFRELHEV